MVRIEGALFRISVIYNEPKTALKSLFYLGSHCFTAGSPSEYLSHHAATKSNPLREEAEGLSVTSLTMGCVTKHGLKAPQPSDPTLVWPKDSRAQQSPPRRSTAPAPAGGRTSAAGSGSAPTPGRAAHGPGAAA